MHFVSHTIYWIINNWTYHQTSYNKVCTKTSWMHKCGHVYKLSIIKELLTAIKFSLASLFTDISLAIICLDIDEFVQERRYSIANALELRLFCTNPSICAKH